MVEKKIKQREKNVKNKNILPYNEIRSDRRKKKNVQILK